MDFITPDQLLIERPASQRVWVVRASGGLYTQTFEAAGIMAIGHVDKVGWAEGPVSPRSLQMLSKQLEVINPRRKKASISSHVNQTKRFCNEIKVDDLVVTVDAGRLMVGRVAGEAFIEQEPVVVEHLFRQSVKMPFQLRRKVDWGPKIARADVPLALEQVLKAHQAVFNLDKQWQAVYHMLYPCFSFEGVLYLSTNIKQKKALNNYSLSQFFSILSGIEAIAKTFAKPQPGEFETFEELFVQYMSSSQLTLTSKAEFMSPGTIWSKVKITPKGMVLAVLVYVMLFGGDMSLIKTDGIIDLETRQRFYEIVAKMIEERVFEKVESDLKIEIPKLDTRPLDDRDPVYAIIE